MAVGDMEQRAVLVVRPAMVAGRPATRREFATLREAIRAAVAVMGDPGAQASIAIDDGVSLRPGWIREKARALGLLE